MSLMPPVSQTASAACYMLGYATGTIAFVLMARRRNIATSGILALLASAIVGGLLGATLGQWLAGAGAGKSILGGVAGGYLAVFLHKRYLGIVRRTGDLFAVAVSAGEAVGRWGCYFGGCCYGKPAHVPWAIWQHGAYRHPTQIYLSLAAAATLAVLLRCDRRRAGAGLPVLPENALFFIQGTLFCALRFLIEFFREGSAAALGLTAAQWACLAGIAFFSVGLARLMRASARIAAADTAG